MAGAGPESDLRDLMQHAACLPYGLSLVEFGMSACVAEILGASAEQVARARAALGDPSVRPLLVGEYEQTVKRREADPEAFCRQCEAEGRVRAPGCPLALIREAEARPAGLESLRSASLEAAAVSFHVHPFVILGAREWLARRERAGAEADR